MLHTFSSLESRIVHSDLGDVFLIIWWIPKPKQILHPTRNVDHCPPMRKVIEAIVTVVRTPAGITYATKGRVGDAGVGHSLIYCNAAGISLREDCVLDVRCRVDVTGSSRGKTRDVLSLISAWSVLKM